MKKKIILISTFFILFPNSLFWAWKEEAFTLYKERVKSICDEYIKVSEENPTYPLYEDAIYKKAEEYKTTEYNDTESRFVEKDVIWSKSLYAFNQAKELYNKTISNQFKCAIINTQNRQLKIVQNFIKTRTPKNPVLEVEFWTKIDERISKNQITFDTLKCKNTEKLKWADKVKKNVLKQTTYETCKYAMYLEYLKSYYDDAENILNIKDSKDTEKTYPVVYVAQSIAAAKSTFSVEKEKVIELLPMVFSAYTEYENNYLSHLYLELIKADFSIVRTKLNSTLAPINQVVYKILNAMKK